MRKTREILKLLWGKGLGARQTARVCGTSHSTVLEYERRASKAGLSWEQVEEMDLGTLERRLFPRRATDSPRPLPEWSEIHAELKRPGVTLQLLWEEYREVHPEGYQYSRFCDLYRAWRGKLDLSMRQDHKAGEKVFVDYCGHTVAVVDASGTERRAQVFVAVLGASNYTYAEATWSQRMVDWIGSHGRAFEYFGGVPEVIVPDNLRSGVSKPCRYEPELPATYQDLAEHYGVAVIPARVRKPQDKAKVEVGVQVVERWILACLRRRRFFSLEELNTAIAELLVRLNDRRFKKLPGTRRSHFEALDQPALRALPATPYEYAEWSKCRVGPDYHVEVDKHFYSVPYKLVGKELEARYTATAVEILHSGQRVACHVRSREQGQYTTLREHMPPTHRAYAEETPQKLLAWAATIGPATLQVAETILSRPHPLQGFNSCLGLKRLAREFGADRLEGACHRAVAINGASYKSLRSILQRGLDRHDVKETAHDTLPASHENVRGASYYQSQGDSSC
jgi:transposase